MDKLVAVGPKAQEVVGKAEGEERVGRGACAGIVHHLNRHFPAHCNRGLGIVSRLTRNEWNL